MTTQSDSTQLITLELSRCLHRTPAGRRCRSQVSELGVHFCERHAYLHRNLSFANDLAPELLGDLTEIECAEDTRRILSKLFILLAQDRIPQKKQRSSRTSCNNFFAASRPSNAKRFFRTRKRPVALI